MRAGLDYRQLAVAVRERLGGPRQPIAVLLRGDHGGDFLVDGHERLAFHLGVAVPQVGGAVGVGDDAVGWQGDGAGDPQPAADEDDGDEPAGGLAHRSRLAGSSTWAMTWAASARGSGRAGLG